MEQNTIYSSKNVSEIAFRECMQRGDDFYRIELLRQAKSCYKNALAFNIETENVKSRISECEKLLSFENKVVYIFITFLFVVMLVYFVAFN